MSRHKKLEEIELLKRDGDAPLNSEPAGEDNVEKNEGYNDEFRDNMDQLFQDETESLNP